MTRIKAKKANLCKGRNINKVIVKNRLTAHGKKLQKMLQKSYSGILFRQYEVLHQIENQYLKQVNLCFNKFIFKNDWCIIIVALLMHLKNKSLF